MRIYACKNKQVLRIRYGANQFLHDYSTNALKYPHNAFVDNQGKIVAFFDQRVFSDNEIWVVMESQFVPRLMEHLKKYLYITNTTIQPINGLNVYWDTENEAQWDHGGVFIPQRSGQLWLSPFQFASTISETEFKQFRVNNHIPLQGVDFDNEMILNVAGDERISYKKGCFLGQEIIARVHYKGKPPKKLVTKLAKDCSQEERQAMTSRVTDPASGEFFGFVFESVSV